MLPDRHFANPAVCIVQQRVFVPKGRVKRELFCLLLPRREKPSGPSLFPGLGPEAQAWDFCLGSQKPQAAISGLASWIPEAANWDPSMGLTSPLA